MKRSQTHKISGTVLVADDHEVVRYAMVQMLKQSFGVARVLEARCFDDVMHALESEDVQLVLCDLGMPGLQAPHQLSCIRRLRPQAKLVVLSGREERSAVLAALEAGVHGYLLKSTPNEENLDRLSYILGGQIYVPPLVAVVDGATQASQESSEEANGAGAASIKLSRRQRQVLEGLVRGLSNKEIARELELAEGTIKMHVGAVLRALGVTSRTRAAALGQQLLEPAP